MIGSDYEIDQQRGEAVITIGAAQMGFPLAQELVDELMQRMRCDNVYRFILDLEAVEYMDSACLGCLVQFVQELEHIHGKVVIVGARPNVAFLFKVTRLDAVFPICDDLDEAREALAKG